ncbi:leukotoxin LktA family filamentous adhesin [Vannielia litorea]|uniref:Haemagglutination activity domain-containing protein n=1 Tax=Vannielia litorea TaxID=1217970 RepID=A0A1N6F425_9RHOB|nr:leukotoxin LktA family filamentous adhesin [Vannielia litorea]SIN90038.1 haemagglutination activity domain-containing protein [Vannielia litorea]
MTSQSERTIGAGAPARAGALRWPGTRRALAGLLGTVSFAAMQVLPAAAQVVPVAGSGTTVSAPSGAVTVETSNVRSGTAYNQFESFNVGASTTVDLYQPVNATALVNIIRSGGGPSQIDGTVNARWGLPGASVIGGNVYFVNADGFVVSSSGVINAGHLTLTTPTTGFVDDLTAEANGNVVIGSPTQTLFAGGEPLNPSAEIEMLGEINASRLDMRAGLRMIADGRISVSTSASTGRIDPAVNIQGVPTAGGVQIGAGGVIRLVSGGAMEVRGQVSAKGDTAGLLPHGGLVEGIAGGELTLGGGIDVSNGAGDAGSVMMFTTGSAVMEPALDITASSTGGAGGFFALRAVGDVRDAQGAINTGSGGEGFILGENVTVTGNLTTGGGSLGIRGTRKVTVAENAAISTRAPGAADPFLGDPGTGAAGDLVISSREIDVQSGAILRADSASADGGGFLGLIARNTNTGIAWAINPESEVARVTIDSASLTGGAVVISAVAKASNSLGAIDEAVEATQVEEMEAATPEAQFEQMLEDTLLTVTQVFERGITTLNGLVPVQVQVLTADASVTISDSDITANGNWHPISASVQNETPEFASNGYLQSDGLREDEYEFLAASSWFDTLLGDNAYQMRLSLPSVFDGTSDSLVIHSHAETALSISPLAYGLGVSVASTDTRSQVSISQSDLATEAGNIRLASTALENHTVNIAAKKIANGAGAVAVTVRNLANQLVVDGGSIASAGRLDAGAFTGRTLSTSTVANSGAEGRLAVAVVVDISQGLTEAALGGTVTAAGDVAVEAETLFFDVSHATTATMGLANVQRAINNHRNNNNGVTSFANALRNSSSGSTPDPNRKPHFGLGVAVNLQLSHDTTRATIGGSYHDFADHAVTLALDPTSVTTPSGAVTVNSAFRFADRGFEGGGGFTRSTSAAFGKLTLALQYMVTRHNNNPANANDQVTEDELLGRFSNALMLNVSLSSMVGETTAEIGANATVNAASLDVNALTRYPNTNPVESLVNQWETYVDQVTTYEPVQDAGAPNPPEPAAPPAPDLAGFIDIVNPLTYLTTDSKAKGEAPVADDRVVVPGEEQQLAIGLTLTYFNTDNTTEAVIREGAQVTLSSEASVTALQEALFLHVTNLPKKNPLGGTAKVNDSIGGGIHFGRTVSDVRAEIESGAAVTVTAGDLDVTATNRNIVASLAYSGGQGSDVAVNASIAAQVNEVDTLARIGEAAEVVAQDVRITATDNSVTWSSAGAITGSENVGVGASGVFNFNSRTIWAGIGPANREAPLSAASVTVVDADTLTILAENNATDIAVGVAGTKVVGKPDPEPQQSPPPNDEDDDMIIPTWLFDDEENDAAAAQQNVSTPADQEGQQQQSGWAVSGAAVLNLTLDSETSAEILSANRVALSGDLTLTARSNATSVNVGGAVSAGLGADKDTNALAGAFAIHVEDRKLRSRIVGAEIEAGNVTLKAEDLATVVNIAVGGAGTSRGDIALAGSVAWAHIGGETTVELLDAQIISAALVLDADDTSTTVSVGGAVGINMDATQGYGVGVGVAVNTINRSALAKVGGTGSVTTGALSLTADSTQSIYAFATSAGVGKTGLAGSISVNTITGGARAHVLGTSGVNFGVSADSVLIDALETNTIFALGGALAGGRSTAVGGALTVNVVTDGTEARLDHASVSGNGGDLGAVTLDSDSTSTITTIAVAGAAALDGNAAGIGLSVNEITAGTLASLEGSTVTDAAVILATADGARTIRSLGGGAAASGRGAAGVAATVNLLLGNDTKVVLDGATLSTRDGGALTATATAAGEIASLAVGLSASQDTSIGGAVTVNVTTAQTGVSATAASLTADGALALSATDSATISSLAGGAALSVGGNGVGGAVAANFIAHDTSVVANGGSLTGEGISLSAGNTALLQSMAVGLAGGSSNAVSGSIAIGDIGNTTRAQAAGTTLAGGSGAISVTATRTGDIDILAGSAAVGGTNAVGAALTVATLHGGVTADVIASGAVTGSALGVSASKTGTIDALAVAGAVGTGGAGGAGSLVYTQIGRPGTSGPSVEPLPGGDPDEDPLGDGQQAVAEARDAAITDLASTLAGTTSVTAGDLALALDTDDVVRARVELTGPAPSLPALTLTTTDTAETRSLAGAVGVGVSSAGFGAGIAVNLLFGKAESELILPAGETATAAGVVTLTTTQTGTVSTAGVAGGGGGSVGGAGSITVNVMNRQASARIAGASADDGTTLATNGGNVALSVTQGGTISSLAGSVGIGANAGFGGAIAVNVMSDDAAATVEDITVTTASDAALPASPLAGAGALSISADQTMTLGTLAAAVAGSGTGGSFAGSIGVNIADGEVTATLRRATARASAVTVEASATPTLTGIAGAISGSATVAAGVGIVTNVTRQTVRADVDSATVRATGAVQVRASATGTFSGNAISGAGSGTAAVTGSGIGNSAENTVEALVRDTDTVATGLDVGSDIATSGSVLIAAQASNTISLLAGTDETPGISVNFAGGGVAGVGASVTVNTLANKVKSAIEGNTSVIGLGYTGVSHNGSFDYGVTVAADAASTIDMVTANGAVGGVAGVAALFSFNLIDDSARVVVGETGQGTLVRINPDAAGLAAQIGVETAAPIQDTRLRAATSGDVTAVVANVAIGGKAGVGAGSGNTLATSLSEVAVGEALLEARDDITLDSSATTNLETVTLGLAGGFVGVSANASVNRIGAQALVTLDGASLDAGDDLRIKALVDSDSFGLAGAASGGVVGASGGVQVTLFDSTSKISVGGGTSSRSGGLDSGRDMTLEAETDLTASGNAVSGAVGGAALALAANISLIEAETAVDIGAGQTLTSQQALTLRAKDTALITSLAGSVGGGALGVGASLDYVNFAGTTRVSVGEGALLEADPGATGLSNPLGSSQNLTIEALSRRDVSSSVVAIGAGGLSFSGAVSIVEMGAHAQDEQDDKRGEFLADAQTELGAGQDGDSGKTGDEKKSTAGHLVTLAGGDSTQSRIVSARQSIDLVGAPGEDVVQVSIADDAQLLSRGSIDLSASATTAVTQLAGGGSASLFGGATSGIAVANLATGATIEVGQDARLAADGRVSLTAENGEITGRNIIDSQAATVAASAGYSAGVGVSVATLSGRSAVSVGRGTDITGLRRSRAAEVDLSADRSGTVSTDTFNLSVSIAGGVGVAVSHASNTGTSAIELGTGTGAEDLRIRAATVDVATSDSSRVTASGEGSSGGIAAGVNSVVITADGESSALLTAVNTDIRGTTVTLANESSASARAEARGIAIGAVAIGAGLATANMGFTLDTDVSATIDATTVTLATRIIKGSFDHASATAASTSGGILAGNGAVASAFASYDVRAAYAGSYTAADLLTFDTSASSVTTHAHSTGRAGGAVAIGLTISRAGQDLTLPAADRPASVATAINGATLEADEVVIATTNAPNARATSDSGSGGLVSGSGAETYVTLDTATSTTLGETGAVGIEADTLRISSGQAATLGSKVNTVSAAAVGKSGALSDTDLTSAVTTRIGGLSVIEASNLDLAATTAVDRPQDAFNVQSGSGGALDIPAMQSTVNVSATTDLALDDGARLIQTGVLGNNQFFRIGTFTDMSLTDRQKLDAGGAVAIPIGNSRVSVDRNDATVSIGAATVTSVEDVTLYSGGDAALKAEVDSTSYGLAGAATGQSYATYNADNRVEVGNGARIEAMNDIRIQAGYSARQAQSVNVDAETRVFNKTAVPIPTDPVADAAALTTSIVDIQLGAEVIAVRDVYLLAEEGSRDIVGYGRGKDLYREVLAELGSAINEAFGGEPVSLDIESGTSTNSSNDGILVNGYVRAGSRNRQVLVLDENNQLANASTGEGYTDDMAEGIEYSIREDVLLTSEVQNRINLLNGLIADPTLSQDAAAVAAWTAERDQLVARAATLSGTADFIDLEDIIAAEGNIILRADYVHGENFTGTLDAPGDARIIVYADSDAFINTKAMIIPENAGGRITFNDVTVTTPADITALSDPLRPGPSQYTMISGDQAGEPLIEVVTYGSGSIIVGGNIYNPDGIARINSNFGDLDVRGDISARTVQLSAGRDFIQGFTLGFSEVDGDPREIYEGYFESVEDLTRYAIFAGYDITADEGGEFSVDIGGAAFPLGTLPDFELAPRRGQIRAGRNVYITADKLNINGLIQAGTGSYTVDIGAGLDADIAAMGPLTGTVLLYDPAEPVNDLVVRNPNITSNVKVEYDPFGTDADGNVTGRIVISPMVVQGGIVELTGEIFSTGGGEIRSLDGFGNVTVTSASAIPIELGRVDLGELGDLGQGLEGVVRITDTSRTTTGGDFLITEFRRIGTQFRELDNETFDTLQIDLDGDSITDVSRIVPTNVVLATNAASGRSGTYQPRQNIDLVINRSEAVSQTSRKTQTDFYFWVPLSESIESKSGPVKTTELDPEVTTGLNGVYLAARDPSATYTYRFEGESFNNTTVTQNYATDDKRVIGIGDVVTTWDSVHTATHLYSHRLKADYGVKITFDGADSGGLTVVNTGGIALTGAVNNRVGDSTITSLAGSVVTSDASVQLTLGNLDVSALGGRIDGLSTAFRVDQSAGSVLNAIALDSIDIRELDGDMTLGEVRTTNRTSATGTGLNGQVKLQAEGSILAENGSALVTGSSIELRSTDGGIGTSGQSLRIHEDGAALTARARNDIYIEETTGDLGLRTVTSDTGSVELAANGGAILDRNDIELRDSRTEAELAELWLTDLELTDADASGRRLAQTEALKAERERTYQEYWAARTAAGDAPRSFTLDPATAQALLDGGWTQAQLDAYIAERAALYATWNGEAAYDPDFEYLLSIDEQVAVTDGIEWSVDELNEWVRAGLIRGTGDTNVRIEDPNVSAAGDITLIARDAVGELLPDFVLGTDRAENLRVLSTAERADVTIDDVTGTVTVRQAEDVNFAFTRVDVNGHAEGNLRVTSAGQDIFLAAETAVSIADITTTADISIRTDGTVTDNRDGTAAITGSAIIVESGNTASIGTPDDPLTVNILPGGSLIARSGIDVNLHAIGDMPLQEIFAGGRARVTALGAITDDAATGAVRVRAADLLLSGTFVGTASTPLVIEITASATGALDLTATSGDAFVTAQGDLPLSSASIFGGGALVTTGELVLQGSDTLRFGSAATLSLSAATGIDVAAATGLDITGGTLDLTTGGPVAGAGKRLATAISSLSITATGDQPTPVFLGEQDDLHIATVTQTHEDADTDIVAGGTTSIGTVDSAAEFRLSAGAITEGRIIAERTALVSEGAIGATSRLDITTGRLLATSETGSITLGLRDRATAIEQITAGGAGAIDLTATAAPLTLLAGPGITTEGGSITADVTSLDASANILSTGGAVTLTTASHFTQSAGTRLDAGSGTIAATIGTDMQVAQLVTTNASADALRLTVDGTLSVAPGQTATNLVANAQGALTTLRLGALAPTGPDGLKIQLAELDAVIDTGDTHLNEADGIILRSIEGTDGLIDIFTGGDTTVQRLVGAAGAPLIVSSSGGNILGEDAVLSGGDLRLFAFGGALAGTTTDTFTADTAEGATLHLLARDDLRYTETAGDLRVGFALSDTGDLVLKAPTGAMELGVLGADGALALEAQDRLTVNIIGRATVDLADEVALQLVEPGYYGLREAASPDTLSLTAFNTGSEIYAGLVNAKQGIGLFADDLDVHLYDATAPDGLDLVITDSTGDFADTVDVQSIGDGPVLFIADYFADVRPRTAGRDRSEGWLTLSYGRIGTGQLTHAGPALIGQDVTIDGDVWFRQRSFDMLAQVEYDQLSTVADVQVLAINEGAMTFGMSNEIILVTHDPTSPLDGSGGTVLVLNRRLGGVDLNGGQGFGFGVGVDTDILAFPFTFRGTRPGVTYPENLRQIDEQQGTEGFILPGFITSGDTDENGDVCIVRYSQEPCLELSMNIEAD